MRSILTIMLETKNDIEQCSSYYYQKKLLPRRIAIFIMSLFKRFEVAQARFCKY